MKLLTVLVGLMVAGSVSAKTIDVKMLNMGKEGPMVFEPGFVQASPGDTVKFIPTDKSHSSASVLVPAGAKPWNGKMDQAIEVKLDKEGVYIYSCAPHLPMAMVGVVQVGKATNLAAAQKEATALSAKFVMGKDRLTKYLQNVK